MISIMGHITGWGLVAVTLWLMVITIVHIHKDIGLSTTRGFLWLLAVLVGTLLGVVLYRFFRKQTEYLCESVFGNF
jgi:hypothetical protein